MLHSLFVVGISDLNPNPDCIVTNTRYLKAMIQNGFPKSSKSSVFGEGPKVGAIGSIESTSDRI
jgi:hypothetical protein